MRVATSILPIFLPLLLSGCLQLETRIKLNEDGSGAVTERLKISKELLEIEAGMKKQLGTSFQALLGRERAQQRAAQMGRGVTLVSHKMEKGPAGSLRAVTVYRADDLTELTYLSPFFMRGEQLGKMRVAMKPFLSGNGSVVGLLRLDCSHVEPKAKPGPLLAELTTMEESPQTRQAYRDIAPIVRDLLRGFKIRVVFENYSEILGGHRRFRTERPRELDIMNYSYGGETGGKTGTHPLDSDEAVVDLMKQLLARPESLWCRRQGAFLGQHTGESSFRALIRPSRPLFDKYFKGKTLVSQGRPGHPERKRPASFEEIGDTPANRRDAIRKKD